jgi:hypothetical protein
VTNTFRNCLYAAIAFVVLYFVIFSINLFVGCRPFNAFWNQADPFWAANHAGAYYCFDEAANLIAAATVSVLQDFIACFMPMILCWKLRIPFRQKVALGAIFGVGFL